MIDFNRVGVFGYSAGGKAVIASTVDQPDIKVMVTLAAYCNFGCRTPRVPTIMFTGSSDGTSSQSAQREDFDRMVPEYGVPGMFVSHSIGHIFSDTHAREAMWPMTVSMFRCYLFYDQEACSELNQRSALEDNCFGTTVWRGPFSTPPAPAPPGGSCSDVAPDNVYTCQEQAEFGKCGKSWMQGWCCETCFGCSGNGCGSPTPPAPTPSGGSC